MKGLLISFVVGLLVGVAYGLIRVKSAAPPIIALIGLLGMVLGEQTGGWLLAEKNQATNATSTYIADEPRDQPQSPQIQSTISPAHSKTRQ